jgi:hypothetical protein
MGKQYNTLAHMLLVVHDPTIPQLGPAHKQSRAVVDVSHFLILHHLSLTEVAANGAGRRAHFMWRSALKLESISVYICRVLRYCSG